MYHNKHFWAGLKKKAFRAACLTAPRELPLAGLAEISQNFNLIIKLTTDIRKVPFLVEF